MQIMQDDSTDGIGRVESGTETEQLSAHVLSRHKPIRGQKKAGALDMRSARKNSRQTMVYKLATTYW